MPIESYGGNLVSEGLKTVEIKASIPIYADILAKTLQNVRLFLVDKVFLTKFSFKDSFLLTQLFLTFTKASYILV